MRSMARANWLSKDSGFSQDDHVGCFSNGEAITIAMEGLLPGVQKFAGGTLATAFDLLLQVVSDCFADPQLRRRDLKAHHSTPMYFTTYGWFVMAGRDRSTGVVRYDVDGSLLNVFQTPDDLPKGKHSNDPEIDEMSFPTEPEHFNHNNMAAHLRNLLDRVVLGIELANCVVKKHLMTEFYTNLSARCRRFGLLKSHRGGHPLINSISTSGSVYVTGKGRAKKQVDFVLASAQVERAHKWG